MRNSTLINILVLSSSFALPSCVSEGIDDGEATGSLAGALTAAGEPAPGAADDQGDGEGPEDGEIPWLDVEPLAITADQLDSKGEVLEDKLACGLSIRQLGDRTGYWIRNCLTYELPLIVVALDDASPLTIEGAHLVAGLRTVSGTARGRVLRLRRN
jgi:hypothetical protein